MKLSRILTFLVRGGTSEFTKFECAVLQGLLDALSGDEQERLQKRIAAINLVQRLDGGREVNAFAMNRGKAVLDPDTRIDASTGERLLAVITIEGTAGTRNRAKVWLVDGNLFSLEFEESTEHSDADQISSIHVHLGSDQSCDYARVAAEADPPNS